MIEPCIREGEIFPDPEHPVTSMKEEVKVHRWGVVVEAAHQEEHPEESCSFEEIDHVS